MLEDIAILTGGNVISEDLTIKLENVTHEMLETARKVNNDKKHCHRRWRGFQGRHPAPRRPKQLDLQACHRVRSRLVSRRTATINQIRAFLIEQGIAVRAGVTTLQLKAAPSARPVWSATPGPCVTSSP